MMEECDVVLSSTIYGQRVFKKRARFKKAIAAFPAFVFILSSATYYLYGRISAADSSEWFAHPMLLALGSLLIGLSFALVISGCMVVLLSRAVEKDETVRAEQQRVSRVSWRYFDVTLFVVAMAVGAWIVASFCRKTM